MVRSQALLLEGPNLALSEGHELDRKWKIAKAMIGRVADAERGEEVVG
jgi:hypothetical protein